jgi:decaprenylphospho-beta-D-erythro-pentofuranosid-2-ulose 2-reductase
MSANHKRPDKVIVLGALSAIAQAFARKLAADGAHLTIAGRNADRLEEMAKDLRIRGAAMVSCRALDLSACDNHAAELASMSEAIGGANAVVICYGLLIDQAKVEADVDLAKTVLNTNFNSQAIWALSAMRLLEDLPPTSMKPVLIVLSSVAGDRGRQSNFVYGAAKGAMSILIEGIAHKFGRAHNVRAVVIKFGFIDTPMTDGIKKGGLLWSSSDRAGEIIYSAMAKGGPVIYGPGFWRIIMLVVRLIPAAIFDRMRI